jgi:hypothetical protein
MKYVFSPVPSRRLCQSLGIDTIPLKTCNGTVSTASWVAAYRIIMLYITGFDVHPDMRNGWYETRNK